VLFALNPTKICPRTADFSLRFLFSDNLLVADDSAQLRHQVVKSLKNHGFDEIVEAETGRQAVDIALIRSPRLIVMDADLPAMNGVTAAEKTSKHRVAPIVLLSASDDSTTIARAQRAGVMGYVLKPFRDGQLYAAIDLALYQFLEMSNLREEVTKLKENLEARKLIERAKGALIKQGLSEPEAYRRMQKIFMDRRKEVSQAILLLER
jgi:two-component system, response regulator PdtaR